MTPETFQQVFSSTIASLAIQAYQSGVLQYHPMTIADVTISMTMFSQFNQVTVQYNHRLMSVSIFDTDSESCQNSSIQNLIADILV